MAIQSEAASTVEPQKWLGMLQRWCPAVPTAELVAFINLLIEAAGPRRIDWLDDLIVQADNQLRRTGTWKMNRLKQYAEAMSKNPRHLPRLRKLRGSSDFDVALKILDGSPPDRAQVAAPRRVGRVYDPYSPGPSVSADAGDKSVDD
jgi:hypothetical protein